MTNDKKNPFFKILSLLFLVYLGLFIAKETGYYDKNIREKTLLTETKINDFENDLKSGKPVDVISYLPEEKDYSNILTKSANKVSNKIGILVNSKSKNIWDFIKTLFIS